SLGDREGEPAGDLCTRRCIVKIAIDYTPAVRQIAGVGRYTRSLVQALIHTAPDDSYTLLYAGAAPSIPLSAGVETAAHRDGGAVTLRRLPVPERLLTVLWHRWRVPLWADLCSPGSAVFYSPNFVLPPLLRAKGVVTVHDLSFLRYPETHDPGLVAFLTAAVPRAVRAAALVLADSEHTRQDTIALLGVPPEKTAVLLSAADPIFRPVDDPAVLAAMRRRRGLDRPYILSVGTVQPRKNLPRLIAAVRRLRERTGEDIVLVHAGRRGWLYAEVQQAVQDHEMTDSFRLFEDADDSELRLLYAGAVTLAYPSLYEGFGLPCVEAMACRCPVVASDVSSVPEVVGDAGLLVEPTDVEALTDALSRCLGDSELRSTLIKRGTAQAARFTWERSAAELHRLLHEVGGS
ncbi:MAG: glycosyltransferase family 1 protein, partial [Chloroflexota bacterium]|nr:glycosyltransferase family 1 protein [Chloroflexota bacterium]